MFQGRGRRIGKGVTRRENRNGPSLNERVVHADSSFKGGERATTSQSAERREKIVMARARKGTLGFHD